MRPHRLVCIAAFAGSAAAAHAQVRPPRDTAVRLPGFTVTATRIEEPILEVPLAITKITLPDLRAVSGYGIEDALARVPGVIAQSRYGTSDVRLVIRGFGARGAGDRSNSGTSRGVRVLLDGFPETEPDGRTAFDDIDLAAAQSVEVVRSNASGLWGNAAGGVVNVLSRPHDDAPAYEAQSMFGAWGLRRYALRAWAPLTNGAAWVAFTHSTFDGWRVHSDARRALLNAGATGAIGDRSRLGVYLVAANNLMHIPGPLTQAQVDSNPEQAHADYLARDERRYNRLGRLGVILDHDFTSATTLSSMLFANPKYLQRSERGTFRDFNRYHVGGSVTAHHTGTVVGMPSRLSVGVDEAYQDGSIQFYALAPGSTRGALTDNTAEGALNAGLFVQDELTPNDRLSLIVGARYDRVAYDYRSFLLTAPIKQQSKQFERVSPKLGASWMLSQRSSVYANIGGGLEVPAGNETDEPPTGPMPGALLNPLLDAIRSTTYELGTKAAALPFFDARMTLGYDVAVYNTNVVNEIIPYNGGRYYQTAARARRTGLELGVDVRTAYGPFAAASFTVNDHQYARYVVDSGVIDATKAGHSVDLSGNQVMGVPRLMANAEVGTSMPGISGMSVKAGLEHFGRYFANDANTISVPAYTIVNLTAELRDPVLSAGSLGVRGFVTVHNLTDKAYIGSAFLNPDLVGGQPAAFEPGMPRALMVSLSVGRMR